MRRTLHSSLKILIVCFLVIATTTAVIAQTLSKKDATRFKKAEKQYIMAKYVEAEKIYNEILLTTEHGRSIKRLGDIEALVRSNSAQALILYTRALEALKQDLENAKASGDMAVISEAEEWLGSCEKGVSTCGGDTIQAPDEEAVTEKASDSEPAPDPYTYNAPDPYAEKAQDPYAEKTSLDIRIDSDGFFLTEMGKKVAFYENAAITSYFAYTETPLPECSLPTADELKAILTLLLQNSQSYSILSGLDWGDRESLVFITSETFFDDMNDNKCKAFSITKESQTPIETSVDLGGISSVLLLK